MRACSEHVIRVQRCCVSKKVREAICLVDVQKPINIAMVRFFANVIYNKLILVLAITRQLYFGASITVLQNYSISFTILICFLFHIFLEIFSSLDEVLVIEAVLRN